ncbi:LysR family transcriptional regulator [Paracandidimonas soli]|uniref:DNA-binding transcriptional LysR family regulator n=1 Tax=Paracandidimonas soli TaxID=1917182 RepID=A0A4R3V129_9BURK|nr:LysR family transcriptional regulator [Paracandidimonas soli]TCU97240.1 DNA-binding transcriptional LysR family regulator [Paracandidimonas soli]
MDIHLRDLRYFEVLADMQHLGRAAEQLGRSQPALTKCIDRLEAIIGSPLFERTGRGIRLTRVGEVLRLRARMLRDNASEAIREVNEFASGRFGHVRLASGPIAADHLLPELCHLALAECPDLNIEIEIGPTSTLRGQLKDGEIDILIGLTATGDPDLVAVPIVNDAVVVAARRDHAIFGRKKVTLESLLEYSWALPAPTVPSRQWLESVFTAAGLSRPHVQIETSALPLLPHMIARTDLLSFVSRHTLALHQGRMLRELPLPATTLNRTLGATYRKAGYLSPAAERVLEIFKTNGARLFANAMGDAAQGCKNR